jgi:5-formyltetrahydrofolate cyclo-ligase
LIDGTAGIRGAKAALRASCKAALAAIGPERRVDGSRKAAGEFIATEAYRRASLVLAFLSMPSEIDTAPVIEAALEAGKRVAVPRIEGDDIAFVELDALWRSWPRDRWDIPVPPASAPALATAAIASTPAVAIVPGLAFDARGGRLGRGKGYYDRFLSALARERSASAAAASPPPFAAIGFGFSEQLASSVPTDSRDVPLDGLTLG